MQGQLEVKILWRSDKDKITFKNIDMVSEDCIKTPQKLKLQLISIFNRLRLVSSYLSGLINIKLNEAHAKLACISNRINRINRTSPSGPP